MPVISYYNYKPLQFYIRNSLAIQSYAADHCKNDYYTAVIVHVM